MVKEPARKNKKEPRPTDRHVGGRIRLRRQMLGMSQESLADAIGLTFQQIQKYEKGTNRVGASRLQQIAEVLGCQPSWFFEGRPSLDNTGSAGARRVDADLTAFMADKWAPDLVYCFVRLPSPIKRAIIKVIREVVEGHGVA